jgi:dihydropteroate synthase
MAEEGADVIDVGGESTRPGAIAVDDDEQIARTQPVIAELARRFGRQGPAISIDTRSSAVARHALEAGATVVNDISALRDDKDMAAVIAEHGAGVVLVHMKGTPQTMQRDPHYDNVIAEITGFLAERIEFAVKAGIPRSRIVIDPGIGFGKTTAHNLEILRHIERFRTLGVPVMVGPSRKRFIGELLKINAPAERDTGTAAVVAACTLAGVECVRVHNVPICRHAADICRQLRGSRQEGA